MRLQLARPICYINITSIRYAAIFYYTTHTIFPISTPNPGVFVQIQILVLLLRKSSRYLVFVSDSNIELNIFINLFLLPCICLESKFCKYIANLVPSSRLSTNTIIFGITETVPAIETRKACSSNSFYFFILAIICIIFG